MMKRTSLPVAILCGVLVAGCAFVMQSINRKDDSTVDLSYDRSQFGNAPFPFWFNLKPVEIRTLKNLSKAESGSPDELLALALLASGDVRDSLTFNKDVSRIQAFITKTRPAVAAESDFRHKGQALFESMRKEFLKTDPANDLAGYNLYQSRLSTLLETGKYNCTSSAILYIVLARYFDMPVKGVVLPSHAFVQLTAPDSTIIEIEPTVLAGFDWVHDENFYKSRAQAWFASRGLEPSTYEDYRMRRILEPYRLVCLSMANQHAAASVTKIEDINRLKEMMGYVLDDDADAQKERLAVYSLEFQSLQKSGGYSTAGRMFEKIMPAVMAAVQRFPGNADLARNAAVLEYNHATMLLAVHQHDAFVAESRSALDAMVNSRTPDTSEMYKGLLENVDNFIRFYTDNMNDYADAESLATVFTPYAKNHEWFLDDMVSMYGTELRTFWDKRDWPEVVRIVKKLKAADTQGKHGDMIAKNLEAAYVNWSISYSNEQHWAKAMEVLKECVDNTDSTSDCGRMLDELKKAHGD